MSAELVAQYLARHHGATGDRDPVEVARGLLHSHHYAAPRNRVDALLAFHRSFIETSPSNQRRYAALHAEQTGAAAAVGGAAGADAAAAAGGGGFDPLAAGMRFLEERAAERARRRRLNDPGWRARRDRELEEQNAAALARHRAMEEALQREVTEAQRRAGGLRLPEVEDPAETLGRSFALAMGQLRVEVGDVVVPDKFRLAKPLEVAEYEALLLPQGQQRLYNAIAVLLDRTNKYNLKAALRDGPRGRLAVANAVRGALMQVDAQSAGKLRRPWEVMRQHALQRDLVTPLSLYTSTGHLDLGGAVYGTL